MLSQKKFESLIKSAEWSFKMLNFPREKRVDNIRQLVGFHYAEDGARKRVPVNFIKIATSIYLRQLAARAPRVMITSYSEDMLPVARSFELSLNMIPDEIGLQRTLREAVLEALFSIGVVKVGLYKAGTCLDVEYGEMFADVITLDDLIMDMTATSWGQLQYIGNLYWADFEKLMDEKPFSKLGNLKPDEYTFQNQFGEMRADDMQLSGQPTTYRDKIRLCDLYLPGEDLVVTYAVTSRTQLSGNEWEGPDGGPFKKLAFDSVPGNLLPLAPVNTWRDLHDTGNIMVRKLAKQAENQKTVYGFSQSDQEAVLDFKKAMDGEGIAYNGSPPQRLEIQGPNGNVLATFLQMKEWLSWFAGNLDALGGLGAQTETLGQDRLIVASASAMIADMQAAVIDFAKDIFTSLAWYEFHDPIKKRKILATVDGTDLQYSGTFGPENKKGLKFEDFSLKLDVYSMQDDSPSTKLKKLSLFLNNFVLPLMPAIEAQYGTIDAQGLLAMAARFLDFPEKEQIVTFMTPRTEPNPAAMTSASRGAARSSPASRPPSAAGQRQDSQMLERMMGGAE